MVEHVKGIAGDFETEGKIDSLSNLAGSPVYIIGGEHDTGIPPYLSEAS